MKVIEYDARYKQDPCLLFVKESLSIPHVLLFG